MQHKRFTKTVLWGLLSALCLWLPSAWAQTHRLDDALEAYERGHYRQALELARQAGQAGNARALELAGSMQWLGSRLYGIQVPGDRTEATRLFRAAVALDRDGQLSAARFYLALAGRAHATPIATPLAAAPVAQAGVPTNGPTSKRTDLALYLSALQAWDVKQKRGADVLLVDVRTRAEAQYVGLPEGIDMHIPYMENSSFFEWDDTRRQYKVEPNPQFAQSINALLAASANGKDTMLVLICRSGDRSAKAVNLLAQLGYSQVYSVLDGFEGDLSPDGQRSVNGWKNAGLPWSYKLDKTRLHDTH